MKIMGMIVKYKGNLPGAIITDDDVLVVHELNL